METVLDPTYIRPGIVTKGVVVSLTAIALGLGVLLACFGLSFFFHFDKPVISRLDAMLMFLLRHPNSFDLNQGRNAILLFFMFCRRFCHQRNVELRRSSKGSHLGRGGMTAMTAIKLDPNQPSSGTPHLKFDYAS